MVALRIIGLDPGLARMGWGVIEADGHRLRHIANGAIASDGKAALAERLCTLYDRLAEILVEWQPKAAAVEETFVNQNPVSTLKLGQARAICLLAPAQAGLPVHEYPANLIKKSVVGTGHAQKAQIGLMVRSLMGGPEIAGADAADALAVAICHAHHAQTRGRVGGKLSGAAR